MPVLIFSLRASDPLEVYEQAQRLTALPVGYFNSFFISQRLNDSQRGFSLKQMTVQIRLWDIDFKQQMQGSAEIITEDMRLLERLFNQLRALFKK